MKHISLVLLGMLLIASAHAQSLSPQVVSTSGDRFFGTDVSMSWTVGEIMVETYEGTSIILTQGFQQGEKPPGTPIDDLYSSFGMINVYPNPTSSTLKIEREYGKEALQVRLSDLRGRELLKKSFQDLFGEIDLSHLAEGVYLLHLSNGESIGKTLRIEKR